MKRNGFLVLIVLCLCICTAGCNYNQNDKQTQTERISETIHTEALTAEPACVRDAEKVFLENEPALNATSFCGDTQFSELTTEIDTVVSEKKTKTETETTFYLYKTVDPTCANEGYSVYKNELGEIYNADSVKALGHDYRKTTEAFATPDDVGYIIYQCTRCGNAKSVDVPKVEVNGLYIPAISLNETVYYGAIVQENVDNYNIVASEDWRYADNILIAGHDYNSLGVIHNLKIGDDIWFNNLGTIEHYVVKISEESIDIEQGKDTQGIDTGTCLIRDTLNSQTIKLFTCYGKHRWIVMGEKEN